MPLIGLAVATLSESLARFTRITRERSRCRCEPFPRRRWRPGSGPRPSAGEGPGAAQDGGGIPDEGCVRPGDLRRQGGAAAGPGEFLFRALGGPGVPEAATAER